MSKYIKYLLVISVFAAFSCQKQNIDGHDGLYSEGGLISFSTNVKTKAPIIKDLNGKHFGVYGYSFPSLTTWGTYKVTAKPDLFYRLDVSCGDNGACSYNVNTQTAINGREQWELNKRYAFFAYYPYNVSSIEPSDDNVIDTPYLEYTLPISSGATVDPDNLQDVMTAKKTDHRPTSGTEVRFDFYHRLFCIDIDSQNFNTDAVTIDDLSVIVSGIHYNKTKIYMDQDVPSEPSATSGWNVSNKVTFPILTSATVPGSSYQVLSGDKNLVLIPQNSSLPGATGLTVEIRFRKDKNSAYTTRSATFNLNFQEFYKYTLTINFVGEDVVLVAADPAPWDSQDVTHTFD